MRKIAAAAVVALLASALPAAAQVSDELKITWDVIQNERQTLVAEAMDLSPAEAEGFWRVYEAYRAEVDPVVRQEVALLKDYVARHGSLSDAQAEELMNTWLGFERSRLDLRQRYVVKFLEVVPARKVMRFFQIENRLDGALLVRTAQELPLAR